LVGTLTLDDDAAAFEVALVSPPSSRSWRRVGLTRHFSSTAGSWPRAHKKAAATLVEACEADEAERFYDLAYPYDNGP
jgi:hypothetical protein